MGTDIHCFAEVRNKSGKWKVAPFHNRKSNRNDIVKDFYDDEQITELDLGRNYDLFAILANVRNGVGFAGVVTGEGFNFISQPKGLPNDMDPLLVEYANKNLDHTPSWLSLRSILDFDWSQTTKHQGVVTAHQYTKWLENCDKSPDSYCGNVSGPGVKIISRQEMDELLYRGAIELVLHDTFQYYTCVEWTEVYKDSCDHFWNEVIPLLKKLGKPEDVRLVFWFDS